MNISVDWIKDFVDLPEGVSDKELSERITLGVCEVEGHERTGSGRMTAADALENAVDDLILDIDNKSLTHRPDLWGHYGMAREFAAVFEQPYKDRFNRSWAEELKSRIAASRDEAPITLDINPDSANLGFLALSMDNVTVGESPQWMQRRLNAAGMRPINSIVDISNYVMLETGIPNHIFDRSTIRGNQIVVRRAGLEQEFTTLDEQVRKIIPSDTMVCDARGPSGIAGIMGGLDSSVSASTTGITIESANWVDAEVRRTSTRLGLHTDASRRYGKCLDSTMLETALLRIFELVCELNPEARAVGGIQTANMPEAEELVIKTSPERISAVLGKDVSEELFTRILEALGFDVKAVAGSEPGADGRGFTHSVAVPSWRITKDVDHEADLVEEIGRIIGFDNIAPKSPVHDIQTLRLSTAKTMQRKIQDFLVLRGRCLEVMTYPMVGEALLQKSSWPVMNENLVLANALTPDHDRMRPSLIPSLLEAAAGNCREHDTFRLFESGRSYAQLEGNDFSEDLHQVGILFQEAGTNPFLELADTVEDMLNYLNLPFRMVPAKPDADHPLIPAQWAGSHPFERLDIQITGRSRGMILSVHPQMGRRFKIKGKTALAVLDITEVMDKTLKDKVSFTPLDRFPGSVFDMTVVTPGKTHAADVVAVAQKADIREMRSVNVLDVFRLEDGRKALTLRIKFRDKDKTLDAAVLKDAEAKLIGLLEKAGYPLRG